MTRPDLAVSASPREAAARGGRSRENGEPRPPALRSSRWFGPRTVAGLIHRASVRAVGFPPAAFDGKPVIGICNSWSELVSCNLHLRDLAHAVRRGVIEAGGVPVEFPTISLSENLMKPTTMLYRNLMAMDVEESIRAHPLDGVVLLASCDKTVPAQLMGAASADLPAVMVTGGPAEAAHFNGRELGVGADLWSYTNEFLAGNLSRQEYDELEAALLPSAGHCNEMGTASTMTALVEALGLALPGTAAIPAMDTRRRVAAEATGRRAVELTREGLRPSRVLTKEAFHNAITLLMALGGSTNAVIHLLALAGRVGVELSLERFDEISRRTPVITNLRPGGKHLVGQLFHAGGIPAVMRELAPLLALDAVTVTGRSVGDDLDDAAAASDSDVITRLDAPRQHEGSIAVLRGSLAPDGAVIKRSAASAHLLRHRGRAVVFEDMDELATRIDDPHLEVEEDSVLVLRNAGPRGGPGMPEWGMLPIPRRLLRRGVSDLVRISDARMSGTAFGTVVLHVAPEAAAGGPLAIVRTGDPIVLDVEDRRLELDVGRRELERRLATWAPPARRYERGYGALYLRHVMQADRGCDFDFLQATGPEPEPTEPLGLLSGWVAGW